MFSRILIGTFALAATFASVPTAAQTEPEEPRTTYQITYLKLGPDGQERWSELMDDHYGKARAAAGLPATSVYWFSGGEWDIMLVTPMPGGMATLDSHNPATGTALRNALIAQEGSEEAADALDKEMDGLVTARLRTFGHTHP